MALEPAANRRDVLSHSNPNLGKQLDFHGSLPEGVQTETTGGGSITASAASTTLTAGTTVDDVAAVNAVTPNVDDGEYSPLITIEFLFEAAQSYTDHIYVGHKYSTEALDSATVNEDWGSFLDLKNEQVVAGNGKTASHTFLPDGTGSDDSPTPTYCRFELDYANGTTDYYIRGAGEYSGSFSDAEYVFRGSYPVVVRSDGAGDSVEIYQWRVNYGVPR